MPSNLPFETRYPFLTKPPDELAAFRDVFLSLRESLNLPVRLTYSSGLTGPSMSDPIAIFEDEDGVVADTTSWDYETRAGYGDEVVHQWDNGESVCRIVTETPDDGPEEFDSDIALDPRAYEERPRGVTSIGYDGNETTGIVELVPGNNAEWLYEAPRSVILDLSPGGGLGLNPGCEDEEVLRTLAGQGPDAYGNLIIKAEDCYKIIRSAANEIVIGNDCGPCYTYGQVENAYRSLIKLRERNQRLVDRVDSIEEMLQDGIDRWMAQKDCRENKPIRVALLQGGKHCLSVGVVAGNTTSECIFNVVLQVTIAAVSPGEIKPDTTLWYPANGDPVILQPPDGGWPQFCSYWPEVKPRQVAKATYQLDFESNMEGTTVIATAQLITDGHKPVLYGIDTYELTW